MSLSYPETTGMAGAAPRAPQAQRIAIPRGCTFEPGDWNVLSQGCYPVAFSAAIADKPVAARLLDTDLVVYRAAGKIAVARDLCAHRGTPLSMGWVEGDEIVCPYHGFRYGPDGRCRAIPAHPGAGIPAKLRIGVFPAVEKYGLVWTSLNGACDVPPLPAWDEAGYQQILPPVVDIQGSTGRQMEGFLDVAHFAWVHTESFGERTNPHVPSYAVERTDYGLRVEYLSTVSNYPKGAQHRAPPDFKWLRVFDVYPPFAARLVVHFPDNGRLWILNAPSPISARVTRLFCPIARNFDLHIPVEDVHAFNRLIFDEDRRIVEAQKPEDLPLDLQMEAHITADRTSIAYRKLLKQMGLGSMYVS